MNVSTRAIFVARIFDILAWAILIVGGIATAITLFAGLFGAFDDAWIISALSGVLFAIPVVIYTAVTWASVTLAAVVAGYISQKSE